MVAIEEIFSYQFSFADIEADKYIEYRRSHADPRIHAMDRLTDDVVDELVKLCLPFSHKKNGLAVQAGRPYMRLEMMVRLHLLQISLNYSDLQGSSSKTPVTKPDGTKMFRSVFLNDARRCCFFYQHNSKILL